MASGGRSRVIITSSQTEVQHTKPSVTRKAVNTEYRQHSDEGLHPSRSTVVLTADPGSKAPTVNGHFTSHFLTSLSRYDDTNKTTSSPKSRDAPSASTLMAFMPPQKVTPTRSSPALSSQSTPRSSSIQADKPSVAALELDQNATQPSSRTQSPDPEASQGGRHDRVYLTSGRVQKESQELKELKRKYAKLEADNKRLTEKYEDKLEKVEKQYSTEIKSIKELYVQKFSQVESTLKELSDTNDLFRGQLHDAGIDAATANVAWTYHSKFSSDDRDFIMSAYNDVLKAADSSSDYASALMSSMANTAEAIQHELDLLRVHHGARTGGFDASSLASQQSSESDELPYTNGEYGHALRPKAQTLDNLKKAFPNIPGIFGRQKSDRGPNRRNGQARYSMYDRAATPEDNLYPPNGRPEPSRRFSRVPLEFAQLEASTSTPKQSHPDSLNVEDASNPIPRPSVTTTYTKSSNVKPIRKQVSLADLTRRPSQQRLSVVDVSGEASLPPVIPMEVGTSDSERSEQLMRKDLPRSQRCTSMDLLESAKTTPGRTRTSVVVTSSQSTTSDPYTYRPPLIPSQSASPRKSPALLKSGSSQWTRRRPMPALWTDSVA